MKTREKLEAFLKGVGSIIDLTGISLGEYKITSDAEALQSDCQIINNDFQSALNIFETENSQNKNFQKRTNTAWKFKNKNNVKVDFLFIPVNLKVIQIGKTR